KAYNAAGESAATSVASCFTLAKVPNQPIILSTSEDKIILQIDPNDDNPTGTEYAIKELNSSEYIQADGTFSANKTWQTYENWGGVTGIEVIGVLPSQPTYPEPNPPVNAAFHVSLTSGQNYSFVVIARNGDGFETAPSSVVSSITSSVPVKAPKIVTTKGVGINLALYQTSVFGKIAQAAGIFISGNAQNQGNSILDEFSFLLNFILLVLAIILIINLFKTAQYLKQDNNCKKCLGVIWLLLTREPAKIFIDHAAKDPEGNYIISYDKHRSSHLFGRKTLLGALSILALKLVILLSLIFGLIKVNHFGIAQTAPYDQTGTPVNVGDTLNYIIEINNQGTGPANDAVIMDTLDSSLGNFAVTGITDCGTYTDKSTAAVLNVDGFDLAPGSTCVITFTVKVKTESEGNTITNQALILGSNFSTVYTNSTSNTVRAVPVPLCGNAKIDSGEQCDPAGCKSDERCVNCQCHPIPPASVCGNGKLEAGEQCDPAGCGADQNCVNCRCQEVVIPPLPPIIPPVIPPVIPPITPPGIPGVQPSQIPIISPIINAIKTIIPESVNAILDNPQVEQTSQNIVTPILLTVAVLTTVPLIASISIYLLPYLHLIFLEPFLLLFRKKRKKWGVVYNALTKIPVDLVLVRVYRQDNNQLIQTKVTDREGRYILIINEPGKYYLTVTKPGFVYPTKYLLQDKQDAKYLDLYHGEPIQVTEKDAVITANIPLDPAEKKVLPIGEVVRSYLLKNIRLIISYIGMILALLIVIIYPTAITIGALILHVILFLSFRRVVVPAKPKSWGIVYDDQNKMPLHQAIVRIFDTRFNKLLETQITDRKGRYAFLVGKNEYQLLTEKEGYQPKEVKPVDLVKNEEVVNLDVGMQKS
ncbi:MAG: hypothetical protein NTX82_03135, partial [Candidatus Parcubacteria bacterium]|nr:hypothetical protein [Candidatus Parcubacteria bacterium]